MVERPTANSLFCFSVEAGCVCPILYLSVTDAQSLCQLGWRVERAPLAGIGYRKLKSTCRAQNVKS